MAFPLARSKHDVNKEARCSRAVFSRRTPHICARPLFCTEATIRRQVKLHVLDASDNSACAVWLRGANPRRRQPTPPPTHAAARHDHEVRARLVYSVPQSGQKWPTLRLVPQPEQNGLYAIGGDATARNGWAPTGGWATAGAAGGGCAAAEATDSGCAATGGGWAGRARAMPKSFLPLTFPLRL